VKPNDKEAFAAIAAAAKYLFRSVVMPWAREMSSEIFGLSGALSRHAMRGRYWVKTQCLDLTFEVDVVVAADFAIIVTFTHDGSTEAIRLDPDVDIDELREQVTAWIDSCSGPIILPPLDGERN
jgi:hypothetical protein